ncbi:MAG: efflux RND transporter permease subunit, partial [Nitrospira sp.]|nr:efflux RND transporter permease subunit [Nitrospira sp.]MDH4244408.1 efflux RND transporter permease subunit [Nitrospira sp.]MDH4358011.1 efflux RND transporter permease subunit [Nitrospira sp.]MDH5319425.1 efflux RND transporter permease subunit [Nitrospira sp.]
MHAGIIVRNSILLVDFIQLQERAGVSLSEAVINAGAIRTRPILLTAAALMVGAFVIILDPIFQGLAVSLLFGVGASTLLTLVVIPVLYFHIMGMPAGPNPADGCGSVRREVALMIVRYERKHRKRTCASVRSSLSAQARRVTAGSEAA